MRRIVVERLDAREQLASPTVAGSSISSERMPTCLQPAILPRTYERDAGLSPTRMTASAGVTP